MTVELLSVTVWIGGALSVVMVDDPHLCWAYFFLGVLSVLSFISFSNLADYIEYKIY